MRCLYIQIVKHYLFKGCLEGLELRGLHICLAVN